MYALLGVVQKPKFKYSTLNHKDNDSSKPQFKVPKLLLLPVVFGCFLSTMHLFKRNRVNDGSDVGHVKVHRVLGIHNTNMVSYRILMVLIIPRMTTMSCRGCLQRQEQFRVSL